MKNSIRGLDNLDGLRNSAPDQADIPQTVALAKRCKALAESCDKHLRHGRGIPQDTMMILLRLTTELAERSAALEQAYRELRQDIVGLKGLSGRY